MVCMNAVDINVSKSKNMLCATRLFGEVVIQPFKAGHTERELSHLAKQLKSLDGKTRVVMEATSNYYTRVARTLHEAGIYVTVVHAMLAHDYGNNGLRQAKADKQDAMKLASYAIEHWLTLPQYFPEEDTRLALKTYYRQYQQYSKLKTMLNNNFSSLLG